MPNSFSFCDILIGNDSADDDQHIVESLFLHQFHDPRTKRHVGAGQNRESDDIGIFLQCGIDDLFGVWRRPV